jgi:phenylalanyl-tRNA synthetase beta chain
MRVSLEWLGEYVDITVSPHELAEMLTNSGTAVEGVEAVGEGFGDYLVGRVLEVGKHPEAERLSICRVDLGGKTAEIVCGAPNVSVGAAVPVALPGSILPDGTRIKEVSIRGVASSGMLLSERELGISDEASGIMLVGEDVDAGSRLDVVLGLPDTVLDLEITPNRPDCLSMIGVAREVAALTGQTVRKPRFELIEEGRPAQEEVRVEILDGDLCSRYAARIIDDLEIKRAPWWMRRRLQAAGIRPISNVVDITNYVMMETGQPLHAFDYNLVRDGHIIVRRAEPDERMTTLDGIERKLTPDDLLICDPSGPIALAGVMGGEYTEVHDGTNKVLLESAHFDAPNIMRTAKMQDLPSEASYRFERGVDPNGCVLAADRAAFLMRELAGGRVSRGVVDARARVIDPMKLRLRTRRAGRFIGIPLEAEEAADLLRSIEIDVLGIEDDDDEAVVAVEVPTFRPDLEREIDLVEEVARLYGYDRIPATLPLTANNIGSLNHEQRVRRDITRIMMGLGLHEAITMTFISPRWPDILDPAREYLPGEALRLSNPISEETSLMRTSLLPGLLEAVRFNLNRRVMDVGIFEMGNVFIPAPGEKLPREPLRLGCVLTGLWSPKQWDRDEEEVDFYTAKGTLEALTSSLSLEDWSLRREELPFLHPAQSCLVSVGDKDVGFLGIIHPRVAEEAELPQSTAVMELDVGTIISAKPDLVTYREIPRFPSVQMDLAVVVREGVDAGDVEAVIREAGGELLRDVRLFDLYRGEQLGEGEKSLAFSLSFYALDRTLRDEEARSAYEDIVAALSARLGASLRS